MRRSSVSIMANIAEGFDSGTHREFHRFLVYGLRSVSELQSHLYIATDQEYFTEEQFRQLYNLTLIVKRLIIGFIKYLRDSQ